MTKLHTSYHISLVTITTYPSNPPFWRFPKAIEYRCSLSACLCSLMASFSSLNILLVGVTTLVRLAEGSSSLDDEDVPPVMSSSMTHSDWLLSPIKETWLILLKGKSSNTDRSLSVSTLP